MLEEMDTKSIVREVHLNNWSNNIKYKSQFKERRFNDSRVSGSYLSVRRENRLFSGSWCRLFCWPRHALIPFLVLCHYKWLGCFLFLFLSLLLPLTHSSLNSPQDSVVDCIDVLNIHCHNLPCPFCGFLSRKIAHTSSLDHNMPYYLFGQRNVRSVVYHFEADAALSQKIAQHVFFPLCQETGNVRIEAFPSIHLPNWRRNGGNQ